MDSKTWAYICFDRYGYSGSNFDKPLEDKPERLGGYAVFLEPSKPSVHQDGLEALGQKASYQAAKS